MLILTEGPFGQAVADNLTQRINSNVYRLTDVMNNLEMLVKDVDFVAVALWRLYDRECDRLDQICNDVKVPWSCVYLMDGTLWSGPLVIPGFGPCYRCFRRRYLTHANGADREIGLMRAYMKNPDWGPSGFLSPMVWMAASILMTDAQVKTEQAGKIRRIDFFDGSVVDTKVIAVHNCVRCRPQASDDRQNRFVEHLLPGIQEIWHDTQQ